MNSNLILRETGKDPLYKIWHTSDRILFMYVHSGSGSVVTRERNFPIEENALILIPPGIYHYTMPEEPEAYVRSKLFLSPAECSALLELLRPYGQLQSLIRNAVIFARIPPRMQKAVADLFTETAAFQNIDSAPVLLSSALRLLFYLQQFATESGGSDADFMSKAIRYINENISSQLSLQEICAAIGISKYHFCRQFKLQLGVTVMQYILNTRIIMARDALAKPGKTITRISEECGFSSVSYFCQAFKAETGFTPLQYRKQQCHGY